jgi:hypothetical protein
MAEAISSARCTRCPLRNRETDERETPASAATSVIVGSRRGTLPFPVPVDRRELRASTGIDSTLAQSRKQVKRPRRVPSRRDQRLRQAIRQTFDSTRRGSTPQAPPHRPQLLDHLYPARSRIKTLPPGTFRCRRKRAQHHQIELPANLYGSHPRAAYWQRSLTQIS